MVGWGGLGGSRLGGGGGIWQRYRPTQGGVYLVRYVEVIFQLIEKAGDFVGDDIWYRVVQFVTNNEDLQVLSPPTHHLPPGSPLLPIF